MMLRIGQLSLELNPPVSFTPAQLRGAVAALWPEQGLLHQHVNGHGENVAGRSMTSNLIYMYPRIRYGIQNESTAVISGIEEGVGVLEELLKRLEQARLRLGHFETRIAKITFTKRESKFGVSIDTNSEGQPYLLYKFITPWLALSEENYRRYKTSKPTDQKNLLSKILIGNILSLAKSLGYVVTDELKVSKLDITSMQAAVRLKDIEMMGFKGRFSVNFDLPDYIGLGRSVSRGFGTVKRQSLEAQ